MHARMPIMPEMIEKTYSAPDYDDFRLPRFPAHTGLTITKWKRLERRLSMMIVNSRHFQSEISSRRFPAAARAAARLKSIISFWSAIFLPEAKARASEYDISIVLTPKEGLSLHAN